MSQWLPYVPNHVTMNSRTFSLSKEASSPPSSSLGLSFYLKDLPYFFFIFPLCGCRTQEGRRGC
ncbi:mCG148493 [Mus musculus]|nr:mCG148493 [Mus musculus]